MEIMKSLFEEIKEQIIIFINKRIFNKNKIKTKSFLDFYINQNFNKILDINLMMITSFIGIILMKYRGFRFTFFIVIIINSISISSLSFFKVLYNYQEADIIEMILLIIIYIFMLISTGGSTLLSHQIIMDGLRKFTKQKEKQINNIIDNEMDETIIISKEIENVPEKGIKEKKKKEKLISY